MFINIDENGTILHHSNFIDEGLGTIIEIIEPPLNAGGFPCLVDSVGNYIYKYVNGAIVALSEQEIAAHPNCKSRMINQLKNKASRDIAALEEPKAHSLGSKKAMGGTLTQDESDFVAAFILARQAILDAYDVAKAAYL